MISEFRPIPEIGVQYKDKDNQIILVTAVEPEKGQNPDAVYYKTVPSSDDREYEALQDDWNLMGYVKIGSSEPIVEPDPKPNPQSNPDPNPQSEPEQAPSDGIYSNDPRINELAKLLQDGPKKFNQEFYPTDKTLSDNNMVEHDVEDAFQKTLDEIDDLRARGEYDVPFIDKIDENGKKVREINPNRKKRRCGFIQEFLWSCGGLDKSLLRMCPTDWAKKAGMGGTILGTSILATFSGGFAAYTVSESSAVAIMVGIIWGLVIFNLDRYLVNSMYSDGKPSISRQELISGLPRIIIALFLGIVISMPIELKIFEGEINQNINNEQNLRSQNESAIIAQNPSLTKIQKRLEELKEMAAPLQKQRDEYQEALKKETEVGRGGRGAGYGPNAIAVDRQLHDIINRLNPLEKEIGELTTQYSKDYKEAQDENKRKINTEVGLSKKIEMLFKSTSFSKEKTDREGKPIYKKDKNGKTTNEIDFEFNSLWLVRWLISLMFIILEILPVVNKMMQTDGEYDKLIDLESDTREKLTRTKEFNNINVLRSGNLSMYRNQIIFGKIPEKNRPDSDIIVDEDPESQNAFIKKDYKKRNRNETDDDNYEIYSHARKVCTRYIKGKIDKLFVDVLPENHEDDFVAQDVSKSHLGDNPSQPIDPSNDAVKI